MKATQYLVVLAAGLSLAVSFQSQAQWTFNGVKIFYNAGNVGIGTNNPAHKLDVRTAGSRAVFGWAMAASGTADGVYGLSHSTSGRGVVGYNDAASGFNYGVYGRADSTKGRGVYGYAAASSGINMGVYGKTNSPSGYAGYFDGNVGVTGWIGTKSNAPVDIYSRNRRALRIVDAVNSNGEISPNLIGGFSGNSVSAGVNGAIIGGGGSAADGPNMVTDIYGTIGGGSVNQAGDGAGTANDKGFATVCGGYNNTAGGHRSAIGGGIGNAANGESSSVGGGASNTASGRVSTVTGGEGNTASGSGSTVCGGLFNVAGGNISFAAGNSAKANHLGSFVWGDSTNADIASSANNQMTFRSVGGVRIFTNSALSAGVTLAAGGSAWAAVSDRNQKENVQPIDARELLDRLAAIPITTWNYKSQDPSIRHIGPMAQDFHAAFGVGENELRITTIDADGVALAAIQGLHQMVQERNAVIESQQKQIESQQVLINELITQVAEIRSALAERTHHKDSKP